VDFSESMVALGRSLHPDVDFRIGDAEALSFGDAEFDCAALSFGYSISRGPKPQFGVLYFNAPQSKSLVAQQPNLIERLPVLLTKK
jgi:ubiquinone/menaquinone biosynthesis C-methylase UbiE